MCKLAETIRLYMSDIRQLSQTLHNTEGDVYYRSACWKVLVAEGVWGGSSSVTCSRGYMGWFIQRYL